MVEKVASTQEHLDILDIQDNLILLKQGGAALVIQANAVNFDLLSEKEQDAMIAAYSALLNSLSFPTQIVIRSRKLDISAYLSTVDQQAQSQPNPYLRERVLAYKEFVGGLVQKGEVLDKRFYLVIPYYELALGGASLLDPLRRLLGMKPRPRRVGKAGLLQRARTDLEPKRDHLIKHLSRLGIKARQISTPELIELFYEIHNPEQARIQHLEGGIAQYTTALVEPAVAAPEMTKAEQAAATEKTEASEAEGGEAVPPAGKTVEPAKEE